MYKELDLFDLIAEAEGKTKKRCACCHEIVICEAEEMPFCSDKCLDLFPFPLNDEL